MKGSPSAWIVVGLTMLNIVLSTMGYQWIYPLDLLATLINTIFFLGAYSIRRSFGDVIYRRVFSLFAVLLLPNAKSWVILTMLPAFYRIHIELGLCGFLLAMLWHFSKHLNLDDSDVRPQLFRSQVSSSQDLTDRQMASIRVS